MATPPVSSFPPHSEKVSELQKVRNRDIKIAAVTFGATAVLATLATVSVVVFSIPSLAICLGVVAVLCLFVFICALAEVCKAMRQLNKLSAKTCS